MFPGNDVLDVCLAGLACPRLGVYRIPAGKGHGIASAHLIEDFVTIRSSQLCQRGASRLKRIHARHGVRDADSLWSTQSNDSEGTAAPWSG